jgi:hypothetical protein
MTQEEKQARWARAMAEAMAKAQQPVVAEQQQRVESADRAKSLLTPPNSWLFTPKSLD